jgi:hypothetical protein
MSVNYPAEYGRLTEMVRTMRKMQKEYFRTRSSDNLTLAKRFEKRVDDYLAEIEAREEKQAEMFG